MSNPSPTVATRINEVLRRIDLDATDMVVALERTFATSVDDLWDACTAPERLARWFEPLTGELRVGGRYRLVDSGTEGTIEGCEPGVRLVVTWEHGGDTSRLVVTWTALAPDVTRLVLAHTGRLDGAWERFGPAAGGTGWDGSLHALSLHLVGDAASEPTALERWMLSEEGRPTVEAWIDAWRAAHVAAGAAPDEAAGVAERTRAAYLDGDWG